MRVIKLFWTFVPRLVLYFDDDSIVVMFPFFCLFILSDKGYPYFFKMARIWAKFVLLGMGFIIKLREPSFRIG
jgi:1-acyl-sn-glycerol-3-phosphate acyltransferase